MKLTDWIVISNYYFITHCRKCRTFVFDFMIHIVLIVDTKFETYSVSVVHTTSFWKFFSSNCSSKDFKSEIVHIGNRLSISAMLQDWLKDCPFSCNISSLFSIVFNLYNILFNFHRKCFLQSEIKIYYLVNKIVYISELN